MSQQPNAVQGPGRTRQWLETVCEMADGDDAPLVPGAGHGWPLHCIQLLAHWPWRMASAEPWPLTRPLSTLVLPGATGAGQRMLAPGST